MTERFEVAVVGGGMVGAALACALAKGRMRVALLEGAAPERDWSAQAPPDLRVSALTPASQNILEALGAWPGMVARGVGPYRRMRVWDACYGGELGFDAADTGDHVLGHIVENRVTVAALWELFETLTSSATFYPVKVVGLERSGGEAVLRMEDGGRLAADLVVAADGRASGLRALAGIDVTGWPYRQDGLVATVKTERPHDQTAYQRFLPEGPLAFLPLGGGESSIVWTSSTETAKSLMSLDNAAFLEALEAASGGILGRMLEVGRRGAFPLCFQVAKRYTDEHLALVGDAAHTMHPLAGQGVNSGLLDAAALAELLLDAKRRRRPLSSAWVLRRYERWRKGDNLLMLASMDLLKRIYGVPSPLFGQLRSAGMNLVNRSAALKNLFNLHAMGRRGDLPALAYRKGCW